jgi:hypothetical protein
LAPISYHSSVDYLRAPNLRAPNPLGKDKFRGPAEAKTLEELQRIEPKSRDVYRRYLEELSIATAGQLAIHRRVGQWTKLFEEMCRGVGCAGSCEAGDSIGSGDGDWICD